jgi:SAM-dependent methyltransferase
MEPADWDERYAGSALLWTAEPNRFLVAEAGGLEPGRALDLACGEGRNAIWLAERGWRITGVDFSGVAIDKAQQLAASRGVDGEWLAADLRDYEPPARAFDLVLVFYLHVVAGVRSPILRAAAQAVDDGGTFLLVGHDSANLADGYGGPHDPRVLYTAADVVADLDGCGLDVERAERVERPVETPEGPRSALDALVRLTRRRE